jgi:hypothetical protein
MVHRFYCCDGFISCVSIPELCVEFILIVFRRTCASSIYTSTYAQIMAEFGCSEEVAILGLSLFVIGLAIGPMVLSPLSEVSQPSTFSQLATKLTESSSSMAENRFTFRH